MTDLDTADQPSEPAKPASLLPRLDFFLFLPCAIAWLALPIALSRPAPWIEKICLLICFASPVFAIYAFTLLLFLVSSSRPRGVKILQSLFVLATLLLTLAESALLLFWAFYGIQIQT